MLLGRPQSPAARKARAALLLACAATPVSGLQLAAKPLVRSCLEGATAARHAELRLAENGSGVTTPLATPPSREQALELIGEVSPTLEAAARPALLYMRELGDNQPLDDFPFDEATVATLVAERSAHRNTRNWQAADELKLKLQEMGVTIDDVHLTWYLSPRPQRGAREAEAGAQGAQGVVKPTAPRADTPRGVARTKDFGPRGHDYERAGGPAKGRAGQVSLGEVDSLLQQRLQAKFAGNFRRADRLREELGELGIALCDATKRWRADGQFFEGPSEERFAYSRIPGDGDTSDDSIDLPAIESLIGARAAAKRQQDFERADRVAAELLETHSVVVDDARRQWRVVVRHGGYYRIGPQVGLAGGKIGAMLKERAFRLRSYGDDDERAAALLAKLGEMGVVLDERRKTWKRPRRTPQQLREAAAQRTAEDKAAGAGGKAAAKAGGKAGAGKAASKAGGKAGGKKDWRGFNNRKKAAAAKKKGATEGPAAAAPPTPPTADAA